MKKILLFLSAAASIMVGAAVPDSSWCIVISGKGNMAEKHYDSVAAKLLKQGLKHLTGADLKIVTGAQRDTKAIFVGRHADPQKFENGHWQGRFRTDSKGNWYFAGSMRSMFHMIKRTRNHRFHEAGIIRCVSLFLREYAGLKAVLPGGKFRVYTARKSIDFPANFVINYKAPDISYCIGRNTNDPVYDVLNGFLPGIWYGNYGGHSHPVAVPKSVFDKHPEYFFLTRKNWRWRGSQYCISNPGFQEMVYKEMLRKADEGYEWVQLAQADGFSLCHCKPCQEYGNTKDSGEKIWIIHRKLAERFLKDRPGKKVVIICYNPNRNPPKAFNSFPPNVIIELCSYSEKTFENWKNIKVPGGFVTYIYNWGVYHMEGYSPKITPDDAVKQIRLFRKNKVKGIYRCGFGELWGLEGPTYYAYGATLSNPDMTAEKAVKEFCRYALPAAPGALENFYKKLHEVMQKKTEGFYAWDRLPSSRMPGGYRNHYLYAIRYDEKSLAELDALLKKCEKAAPGNNFPLVIRREFDLIRHTARMSRTYLSYLKNPGFAALQRLEKAVANRTNYIKNIPLTKRKYFSYVAGIAIFSQGNPDALIPGGSSGGRFVYPVTWPWKQLMSKKIVPGIRTVKPDNKEHFLLPALMEKWEADIKFKVAKHPKGILLTLNGPDFKGKSAFYFINLHKNRIFFRCGGRVGGSRPASVNQQISEKPTAAGDKFAAGKRQKDLIVKRLTPNIYTVFIPWKYFPGGVMPVKGVQIPFNVSFNHIENHKYTSLTFEPDLKFLNDRRSWMTGRGKLIF